MKIKHNKKRNTAFIYEALVRELTKSVINKDADKKAKITKIIKESFSKNKNLKKELDTYHTLCSLDNLPRDTIEKIVLETRIQHSRLDQEVIFEEQSEVIDKINKQLGVNVYEILFQITKVLRQSTQSSTTNIYQEQGSFRRKLNKICDANPSIRKSGNKTTNRQLSLQIFC